MNLYELFVVLEAGKEYICRFYSVTLEDYDNIDEISEQVEADLIGYGFNQTKRKK